MFLILLFKLLTQFPFVSFLSISILSAPFLNPLSSPSPPSLLSLIICPPKIKTSIYYILFTNGTYFCILFHTMTYLFLNNAFYKLEKSKFVCLSSNLSYPEDLKKQWLPFLISPSLSSIPSCSSDQFSVLLNKHFMFHTVSLLSQAPLARGSRALPSVLLAIEAFKKCIQCF